jgi:hypothetical protein
MVARQTPSISVEFAWSQSKSVSMRIRQLLVCLTLALSVAVGLASTVWAQRLRAWDDYGLPDSSTFASYFRQHATLRLGPEQRLPNGVSWRLVTELGSGITMPRLTWMRDRQRLLAANRLLEHLHAGEMLIEAAWRHSVEEYYWAQEPAIAPLLLRDLAAEHAIIQKDVTLTYAGKRLISLFAGGWFFSSGSHPPDWLRALTFDLETAAMVEVTPCPSVGHSPGDRNPLFRYGPLLDLCDKATYRRFVSLVREIDDAQPVRHLPREASDRSTGCWLEDPGQPLIREDQEYVLYLTFAGLAVQVSGSECPSARTPDNPIIVPYHRLEAFMLPGPWRDELLRTP